MSSRPKSKVAHSAMTHTIVPAMVSQLGGDITPKTIQQVIDVYLSAISENLLAGHAVTLGKIGVLQLSERKPVRRALFTTGGARTMCVLPARRTVRIRPSSRIIQGLNTKDGRGHA